ncbi:MAG: hypothetical protein AAF307_11950 [Pseudomonadota bacterium]
MSTSDDTILFASAVIEKILRLDALINGFPELHQGFARVLVIDFAGVLDLSFETLDFFQELEHGRPP